MMKFMWLIAAGLAWALAVPARGLGADELLLIVNSRVPEGTRLAEFYAAARGVPAGRIVALALPEGDDLPYASYEPMLAGPVREFIKANRLEQRVTCLVTFYGVPLRVASRRASAAEREEMAALEKEQAAVLLEARGVLLKLENEARAADAGFVPPTRDDSPEALSQRAEAVIRALAARAKGGGELGAAVIKLGGAAAVVEGVGGAADDAIKDLAETVARARAESARLWRSPDDPTARAALRKMTPAAFGLIEQARLLARQIAYLRPGGTVAAVDSELAMLHWPAYPRGDYHANPLHPKFAKAKGTPRTLMVARLDAPQAGLVAQMVRASLRAEEQGLLGRVVLDSRAIDAKGEDGKAGSAGHLDQSFRDLALLVRERTQLAMLFDDSPELLRAGAAADVGLYCGWYSPRKYVPSVKLAPGAVAYHVGTLELLSLRAEGESGWCAGLLNDGAAATIGAVGDPTLAAVPPPGELFGMLMTGKLTLAEAYWRCTPTTSWQMALIGDPLYNPFKNKPALNAEDGPAGLRVNPR